LSFKKHQMRTLYFLFILGFFLLFSCKNTDTSNKQVFSTQDLNQVNLALLEAVMEDAFTPPIATRIYAYSHIAHYVTLQSFYTDSLVDISNKLNGLSDLPKPSKENVNAELAALLTFSKTAKKLIFSEHLIDSLSQNIKDKAIENKLSEKTIQASESYAAAIAQHLSDWIDKDMYNETRTYDRFTSTKKPENWRETPPDYETALEPHWDKIRPLVIDSPSVYVPAALPKYDVSKDSDFYKMVAEVYEESKNTTEEKQKIAWFWDCNPILTIHKGHMIQTIHKFAPAGHWMHIIDQITAKENSNYFKTTKAYTLTSIAMFDAVIAAWHLKYKTDLVRPVTYIQEYFDPQWLPVLQTPPFPEYTSGHSATSASAAGVLTAIFGENYFFEDNTQLRFDLESRSFNSFKEAARQVDLSRFYGGIHYMQGVNEGSKQGYFVANIVLEKLNN